MTLLTPRAFHEVRGSVKCFLTDPRTPLLHNKEHDSRIVASLDAPSLTRRGWGLRFGLGKTVFSMESVLDDFVASSEYKSLSTGYNLRGSFIFSESY